MGKEKKKEKEAEEVLMAVEVEATWTVAEAVLKALLQGVEATNTVKGEGSKPLHKHFE